MKSLISMPNKLLKQGSKTNYLHSFKDNKMYFNDLNAISTQEKSVEICMKIKFFFKLSRKLITFYLKRRETKGLFHRFIFSYIRHNIKKNFCLY